MSDPATDPSKVFPDGLGPNDHYSDRLREVENGLIKARRDKFTKAWEQKPQGATASEGEKTSELPMPPRVASDGGSSAIARERSR